MIPSTPKNPVLQRSNNVQPTPTASVEICNSNQIFRTPHKFGNYDHENSASVRSSIVSTPPKLAKLNTSTRVVVGPRSTNLQETTKVRDNNLNLPPEPETPTPFTFLAGPQNQISPVTQEKCGHDHSEIDLNQTPPQKQPKRKKHRPKVTREGKPKRIPTPAAANRNSKARAKSAPKNGINVSEINATEEETSNGAKKSKSCKRRLDFDSDKTPKRVSQFSFDLNLEPPNSDCSIELLPGPSTSFGNKINFVQFNNEVTTPPKNHAIPRILNIQNSNDCGQVNLCSEPVNAIMNSNGRVEVKRHVPGKTSSDKRLYLEAKNNKNSAKKDGGFQKEVMRISVDYITSFLNDLHLWKNNGQSELVPYKGDAAAVVPYEEFDPVKKRRSRPRVDLDPESDRLWNLLMGKEGSQSAETMDTDKQKWWEEERKVFRGRVDSFIARMHLIQGDRRFSEWKGSVLDSLIGVYLTQNVSDHLSSSAFMSLAAKFPLKLSTAFGRQPVQHNEVRITYPDGTTYKQKIPREPVTSNSEGDDVRNLSYLSEPCEGILGSYMQLLFGHQQLKYQGLAAPASNSAYSDPFVSKVPCNQRTSGLEKWEEEILGLSGNEHISTLASTEFEITNQSGKSSEITFGGLEFQPLTVNPAIGQQETSFPTDSTRPAEAFNEQPGCTTHEKHDSNIDSASPNARKRKAEKEKAEPFDWDILRKEAQLKSGIRERCRDNMDSLDYEALRNADVHEISNTIKGRGMNNMLSERMKSFLNRLVQDHESIDLEWLRDVDPDKAKDYLLSIRGLGLKSVECVRLLTLHHLAFPVDTNVGRIAVRLGWVPLQPLPESLQLHLLELYPVLETIQKYLWPRLCKLDQETLYELHYQMITFGKVFCTKREPNCNGCPMRGECRHFASAFASARLSLPGTEEKRVVTSVADPVTPNKGPDVMVTPMLLNSSDGNRDWGIRGLTRNCEPLIEEPSSPETPIEVSERDIEDAFYEDPDEIPTIKLNAQEFTTNLKNFMQEQMEFGEVDMSKALVALSPEFASLPIPKLKHVSRLRTEHQVYELPDWHPLLKGMDRRETDDPSPYLLAIWTPGETADSTQPPKSTCSSQECGGGGLCNNETCFSCNSSREAQTQMVRGTILVPCRTAMRGSFPLNGTYFQVNEVFADHESSLKPIDVPRNLLWNLPRRKVFFGSSVTSIFKGMTTEAIQHCFWKGFVCVRGFDQKSRAPKPLRARLHMLASKVAKKTE